VKSIEIIGGGLAGLTLGIALRREGVPVIVWEAGNYPRHRVCGEFISGRGLASLDRLGLLPRVIEAGAVAASTTQFFTSQRDCARRALPDPALCISRHTLDSLLAKLFCEHGGDLHTNARWTLPLHREGTVRATGRRPQARAAGSRWYGLKAHARHTTLRADLEMHFSRTSYIGACRLANGVVNVCGLFRRSNGRESRDPFDELKSHARFRCADWDQKSFCAVAGIPPFPEISHEGVSIGDALAMPAPLTGNGMSMAFESAEVAIEPLMKYAQGGLDWDQLTILLQRKLRSHFASRLRWSNRLHHLLFQPIALRLMPLLLAGPCWRGFFYATR
jgi:menaquinone-9 beta-reductase